MCKTVGPKLDCDISLVPRLRLASLASVTCPPKYAFYGDASSLSLLFCVMLVCTWVRAINICYLSLIPIWRLCSLQPVKSSFIFGIYEHESALVFSLRSIGAQVGQHDHHFLHKRDYISRSYFF